MFAVNRFGRITVCRNCSLSDCVTKQAGRGLYCSCDTEESFSYCSAHYHLDDTLQQIETVTIANGESSLQYLPFNPPPNRPSLYCCPFQGGISDSDLLF